MRAGQWAKAIERTARDWIRTCSTLELISVIVLVLQWTICCNGDQVFQFLREKLCFAFVKKSTAPTTVRNELLPMRGTNGLVQAK